MVDTTLKSFDRIEMDDYPFILQAVTGDTPISYSGAEIRAILDSGYALAGVVNGFSCSQHGAGDDSIDVSAGYLVIPSGNATIGKYLARLDSSVNVPVYLPPSTGARTHRLIAEVLDKQYAGTEYGWQLRLMEDTGSGTPALPANAVHIALVTRTAGTPTVLTAAINGNSEHARVAGQSAPKLVGSLNTGWPNFTTGSTGGPATDASNSPGARGEARFTYVKSRSDSLLEIVLETSGYLTPANVINFVQIGVICGVRAIPPSGGGTNYDIGRYFFNQSGVHHCWSGRRQIALAAGTWTIQPYFYGFGTGFNSSNLFVTDIYDGFFCRAEEVWPQ